MKQVDLWEVTTAFEALQAAWLRVEKNEGSQGGDGVTRSEFRADQFARLNQLRAELLSGTYRTRPFRKVSVPKKKPGYRILTIPTIRDRIVHGSIATALTPVLVPEFEESSFAYRPGRGVAQAVARIETWRDSGYGVVIEADIVRFFDNIQHDLLREKLSGILAGRPGAEPLQRLLAQILQDQAQALGTPGIGLVQGSPLSPLLANLYLDALDEEMDHKGVKLVRFADDFVILCRTEQKAQKAMAHCAKVLADHGLRLHEDGTRIVSFDKGFDFIGNLFVRTLAVKTKTDDQTAPRQKVVKSEVTDDGVIKLDAESSFDQGHRVLYVIDPRHRLTARNKSISVLREDETEVIAIPRNRVGRIEIGEDVGFDKRLIDIAVEADVEMALIDRYGQTRGTVFGRGRRSAGLQLAQAQAVLNPAFRLEIARRIVDSRIKNQRTQLSRLNRTKKLESVRKALVVMKRKLRQLDAVANVDGLLGIEGAATADFYAAYGDLVSTGKFKRSRPGRDPVNATLNYLTGILERDVRAAAQSTGLNLGFAFLHGTQNRHDGLVFDLMEPFRAPLVEGLTAFLFNSRRLRQELFDEEGSGAIHISSTGRSAIIEGYETAVAKRVNAPDRTQKFTWRKMMLHQSRSLVRAIETDGPVAFAPYEMEA